MRMMSPHEKVLITGAGGLLGGDLVRAWQTTCPLVALRHAELDIADAGAFRGILRTHEPRIVINCAARSAVDFCETHRDEAFRANAEGPRILAEVCAQAGVRFVHLSTDYVFDGQKPEPYVEHDPVKPLSVYSESKAAGERAVLSTAPNHLVVRVAWIFGFHDKSFVRTILRRVQRQDTVGIIADQLGSPTFSFDIADAIARLLAVDAAGLVHFTNEGTCTRLDMTRHFFERLGLDPQRVHSIASKELPWVARRPARLELSKNLYCELTGAPVRSWQNALDEYLEADAECATLARAASG